jgi:hypothetical protein
VNFDPLIWIRNTNAGVDCASDLGLIEVDEYLGVNSLGTSSSGLISFACPPVTRLEKSVDTLHSAFHDKGLTRLRRCGPHCEKRWSTRKCLR